jgi:hypothetical protein
MGKFFIFPALLLCFLLAASCGEEKRTAGAKTPAASPTPTREQNERAINLKPKTETPAKTPPLVPRAVSDTTALFALNPQERLVAQDFKIGSLQDMLAGRYENINAVSIIREFLNSLEKKKVKQELIKEDMRTEITRSLQYPINQGLVPETYRIGKAVMDNNQELSVNVRLFKGQSSTEGEIYMAKIKDAWVITDFQVGLTLLAEKQPKDTEPFSPSSYKWLLKDYLE